MDISEEINKRLLEIYPDIVNIRREIHRYPEIAFCEVKTAGLVFDYLKSLGIEAVQGVAKTGVVGLIEGSNAGRTVALRADMDALPITEKNECAYRSCVQGLMHACGHDVHIACLLGAANILNGIKDRFDGNVKLIFQPAEEGMGGALSMIRDGVLQNPGIDACAALHVWPDMPVGKIGIHYGTIFASGDRFEIIVKGKGGHGAVPHYTVDPIVTGAQMISALQTIVSRRTDALSPVVLSVCTFHAGTVENVIPDEAVIKGTIRTMDREMKERILKMMESIISGIAESAGAKCEFKIKKGYPATVNNGKLTDILADTASKMIGSGNVLKSSRPNMVSEDFSYYTDLVPCTYFILGCANKENGTFFPLHHARFDVDEQCIKTGAGILARFVLDYLRTSV